MQQEDLPVEICREDDCDIEGIHEPHEVRAKKEQQPRSKREPWKLMNSPEALDESIMRVINRLNVASFQAIFHEVENDFGSIGATPNTGDRTLHRHLVMLCRAGRLLRVDVGQRMYAYLKPSAKFARDVDFVRDILDNFRDTSPHETRAIYGGRVVSPRRMV
jgi:hypothetical protein